MNESKPNPFFNWVRAESKATKLLFRSIPSIVVAFFVISVVTMNLLANKTLLQIDWIAVDAGILVSWLAFLSMDIVTKHFGPRASIRMSVFALLINLLTCLIFFVASVINTQYSFAPEGFNAIFGGTWYILLSSSIAFIVSAIVNNVMNWLVGLMFKKNPDGMFAFIIRAYVSTFIGQFIDNFVFSILLFMVFFPIFENFGWTIWQCLGSAILGAALELLFEAVFTPFGYFISRRWKKDGVGKEYFEYINSLEVKENENLN